MGAMKRTPRIFGSRRSWMSSLMSMLKSIRMGHKLLTMRMVASGRTMLA